MKKTRTIKELLILLKNSIKYGKTKNGNKESILPGMCNYIYKLYKSKRITAVEHNILTEYLYENKPKNITTAIRVTINEELTSVVFVPAFWFMLHEKKPRVEWLDKQIENL